MKKFINNLIYNIKKLLELIFSKIKLWKNNFIFKFSLRALNKEMLDKQVLYQRSLQNLDKKIKSSIIQNSDYKDIYKINKQKMEVENLNNEIENFIEKTNKTNIKVEEIIFTKNTFQDTNNELKLRKIQIKNHEEILNKMNERNNFLKDILKNATKKIRC